MSGWIMDKLGRVWVAAGEITTFVYPDKIQRDMERTLFGTNIDSADFGGYADEGMTTPILYNVKYKRTRLGSGEVPAPVVNLTGWRVRR